ncbi:MAG TPA: hypothetical protein VLA23_03670 [Candidatus Limnocylindrales bacterium]|nr:hypothetical protein [Candidatus Limnocylindrales bacterium]
MSDAAAFRCPWCSKEVPAGAGPACPHCGASLAGDEEAQVPGVTSVDAMAVLDAVRAPTRQRSRLLAWLSGEQPDDGPPPPPGSLAPPSDEVRREMLRLKMAAELSELSAEAELQAIEDAVAAADRGESVDAQAAIRAAIAVDQATDALVEPDLGTPSSIASDGPAAEPDTTEDEVAEDVPGEG